MINGPLVRSINNSRNSVLPSFENVQYPQVFSNLYNFVCKTKQCKHKMMTIVVVIYVFMHGFRVKK
jgi:hypothetical protein